MILTQSKQFGWGKLSITANMANAADTLMAGHDGCTLTTPFHVADANHSWPKAFELVNQWLADVQPEWEVSR
jgi:hypothetical protein